MTNPLRQRLETLREPLARRVAAGELDQAEADAILKRWEEANQIFEAASARATARAGDHNLTPQGKAAAQREDAAEIRKAVETIRQAIAKAVADHQSFVERAPHMTRSGTGWIDSRSQRDDQTPEGRLLRHLEASRAWDYLKSLPEAPRGVALRGIADSGADPDRIVEFALEAPGFMGLVDPSTRRYIVEARLKASGMATNVERSQFKTSALQHLDATITSALRDFGAPPEAEPVLRTMPDGSAVPVV